MKIVHLILCPLFALCWSTSYATDGSKAICEKGIFPSTAPDKQGVIPSMTEENDYEEGEATNQTTPPNPTTPSNNKQNGSQGSESPDNREIEEPAHETEQKSNTNGQK